MFNLCHICLLRAFEHIHMEFARQKCLLLLLLLHVIFETFLFLVQSIFLYWVIPEKIHPYLILYLDYLGSWVLKEIWIIDLSSTLVLMLISSSKLFLFSKEVHLNSGVRLLLELYCVIVIKNVAFFTILCKQPTGQPSISWDS